MIQPIGDRVLVALPPRVDETVSAGGIVLMSDPDRFHAPTRGIVVALGEKGGTVDLDDVVQLVCEAPFVNGPVIDAAALLAEVKALAPAPFDVQLGDCVIFPRSAGEEIHDGDLDYVILRESEIIGVVEPIQKDTAV